jgi:hypothetical protein
MVIDQKQMLRTPKRIGHTDEGDDVFEVCTKGGLVMVATKKGQKMTTLGVGPHRAVARYIASQKMGGKLHITELSKSEGFVVKSCPNIEEYWSLTDRLNSL